MLSIAVLDAVEVERDGVRVPVRPGKTSEVLIRLALDAGSRVRTEQLIEDLWAGQALATARNTLQTKVSRLRRALGDAALVTGTPDGYALHVDPRAVDALEVSRLSGLAAAARATGDASAAHATCVTGLALFGGDVLARAGDGDWVTPHRVRLEQVRLALTEGELAARLDLGGDVVAELEALVLRHPLTEALWALLMVALYRGGRQADALGAYRRVAGVLDEEVGLAPGPALQAMERRVLLQDPSLDAGPAPQRAAARGNVAAVAAPLLGRDDDLRSVQELVRAHRLVTVVGTAGVGKTRLAEEVARGAGRVRGAWLVRLEGARAGASVLQAVAATLGVAGGTEAALLDHLAAADLLLVLDNCEHVVDAVVDGVGRLLDAAPGITVLCTSQVPLGLDGEVTHPLEPLALADSVALFTRLARAQRRSVVLDGSAAGTVIQVCRALDGLPLAIELAAARTRTLPVEDIARRLTDRFALLADPTSRRPERRRALGAAIGWSYDLLFPDDQRGLWALACSPAGASLSGVEQVLVALGVPASTALDVLTRLAARSLVVVEEQASGVRYRLLDSIHAYAADRLVEAGLADAARLAHACWVAAAADRARDGVRGPGQAEHLAFVRTERDTVDAALAWAVDHDPPLALRIAGGFGWTWFVVGDRPRGTDRVRRALAAAGDAVPADERVRALCLLAWLENHDVGAAHADAQQAVDLAGDDHLAALGRTALAFVLLQQAEPRAALSLLHGAPAVQRDLGYAWDEAAAWILTVHAALLVGDTHRAATACAAADTVVRGLGDDWALGHLDGALGFLAQTEHRYADAAGHLRRAADAAARTGFRATQALHLATLGRILQQAGDPDAAAAVLRDAVELGQDIQDLRVVALGRARLARVLRGRDDVAAGAAAHAADHWFRSAGGGEGARLAALTAAAIDAASGVADGEGRLQEVLRDAVDHQDREVEVLALDALARARMAAGDPVSAVELLAAADAVMPAAQHLLDEADRADAHAVRPALLVPLPG